MLPRVDFHLISVLCWFSQRFSPVKDETPPVGAYEDPRCALEILKKDRRVKKNPFGLTAARFLPENRSKATPGLCRCVLFCVDVNLGHILNAECLVSVGFSQRSDLDCARWREKQS